MKTRTTYVVGGVRIPFMKSMTAYRDVTTPELMTASLKSLVERYNLKGKVVGDVALGALMQSSANWNFAREVVQASGLPATDGYYEVWLLAPDASSMVSVGMLDATEGGTFPLPAGIDLKSFPVVDVSLEHYDGDVTHSSDSILRGSLDVGEV